MNRHALLPEWAPQESVLLALPHPSTDWEPILDAVTLCYKNLITIALNYAQVVLVVPSKEYAKMRLGWSENVPSGLQFFECPTNDTWTRDYGFLTLFDPSAECKWRLADFTFNGWGMKFAACFDNQVCRRLKESPLFPSDTEYANELDFPLEGGAIETDGQGTLLTTSECLLSPNRNPHLSRHQIEERLKLSLGCERVLWLENGSLKGDDTDSHIDTLARFLSPSIIAYTACDNPSDPNYEPLKLMEEEIKALRDSSGKPYKLVRLPIPQPIFDDEGNQLPATYANFLILNGAILVPTYNAPAADAYALDQIRQAMPGMQVIGIDCSPLIIQHGSLHCATMQLPHFGA